MRPFLMFDKCQEVNIKTQYNRYGIRCFHININFVNNKIAISNGFCKFKISEEEIIKQLEWIDSRTDCYLFITNGSRHLHRFAQLCERLEKELKHTKVFGGYKEDDWSCKDYQFKTNIPFIRMCSDIDPKSYAKYHNCLVKLPNYSNVVFIDYVNIC